MEDYEVMSCWLSADDISDEFEEFLDCFYVSNCWSSDDLAS